MKHTICGWQLHSFLADTRLRVSFDGAACARVLLGSVASRQPGWLAAP